MALPGRHWSLMKRNGPEPIGSGMRWSAGVAASRAGIITGSGALGLPSTSRSSGNGCFSTNLMVFGFVASSVSVSAISILPSGSRTDQRLSEATQSSAVTGLPSCHFRPSRSTKVQVSLSGLLSKLSTICGLISPLSFIAKSVSKTCVPKVRVMAAVVACGSRIVTSDSRTTVRPLAARASRGRINEALARATPPASAVRRPNTVLRMQNSLQPRTATVAVFHCKRNGPALLSESRPATVEISPA